MVKEVNKSTAHCCAAKVIPISMERRIKQQVLRRKKRWVSELLPRVHAAKRPNAAHLEDPQLLALLQHLSDGVNELLMTRPLAPFPWLADYLRHAVE